MNSNLMTTYSRYLFNILQTYGIDGKQANIHHFVHPWGLNKAIGVIINKRKIILKKKNNFNSIKQEIECLSFLESTKFQQAEKIIKTINNEHYFIDSQKQIWMAYNWVQGSTIASDLPDLADRLGVLLGKFHLKTMPLIQQKNKVNLLDLRQLYFFTNHCNNINKKVRNKIKSFFLNEVFPIENKLQALPTCIIHGDFNLENILANQKKYCLIDFEFTCFGARITDLVSFFIRRDIENGSFVMCDKNFIRCFLKSYINQVRRVLPLTMFEFNLLKIYFFLHMLKINHDIYAFHPFSLLCGKFLEILINKNWIKQDLFPDGSF